jgi:hypothetical protein
VVCLYPSCIKLHPHLDHHDLHIFQPSLRSLAVDSVQEQVPVSSLFAKTGTWAKKTFPKNFFEGGKKGGKMAASYQASASINEEEGGCVR